MQLAYEKMVKHIAQEILKSYVNTTNDIHSCKTNINGSLDLFEQKCSEVAILEAKWNNSEVRNKLKDDMREHLDFIMREEIEKKDKIIISQSKCTEIASEKLKSFESDKDYILLLRDLDIGPVSDFKNRVECLINSCLEEYRVKTDQYDENARVTIEGQLNYELFKLMQPAYEKMVKCLAKEIYTSFVRVANDIESVNVNMWLDLFQQKCKEVTMPDSNWNYSEVRNELVNDMTKHIYYLVENAKVEQAKKEKLLISRSECPKIVMEKLQSFESDKDYVCLLRDLDSGLVADFKNRVMYIIGSCLEDYRMKTNQYDVNVRSTNEEDLKFKLLKIMQHAHKKMIAHIADKILTSFKETTNDICSASTNVMTLLSLFQQNCAEVTIAESNWSYAEQENKLKDDMKGLIDCLVTTRKEKYAKEKKVGTWERGITIFAKSCVLGAVIPICLVNPLLIPRVIGLGKSVLDDMETNKRKNIEYLALFNLMEESYQEARSLLSPESDDMCEDSSAEETSAEEM